MPDQSSAATEHALLQEITAPLQNLPDDPVSLAADVHFPHALRGYDRIAVDAYVRKTSQLVAELQATRSPEAAVRRALERVGEQISGILQRAHDTAGQITAQSRSEAEDRLEAARADAARITAGAEQRVKDLDAETDRIWSERQQIVEDARELARHLLTLAESAVDRFPAAEEPAPPPADPEAISESLQVEELQGDEDTVGLEEPEALDGPEAPLDGPEEPLEGLEEPTDGPEEPTDGPEEPTDGPEAPFDGEATAVLPPAGDPKQAGDEHP